MQTSATKPLAGTRPHRSPDEARRIAEALSHDARRLGREIDAMAPLPDSIRRYRRHYDREIGSASPLRALRRDACVRAAADADVVLCSDVHTARGPQNVCLELLHAMRARGDRPPILILEAFAQGTQKHLDAYLEGKIDLETLRRRVRYDQTWGFSFDGYARLLEAAREHGIPVLAANTVGSLSERDAAAAEIVREAAATHPNARILVLFGQLHLAATHLPGAIRRSLGKEVKMHRVLTGDHPSYFTLARQGLFPQAVQLDEGTYCIFANRPRTSFKSYLRYIDDLLDD